MKIDIRVPKKGDTESDYFGDGSIAIVVSNHTDRQLRTLKNIQDGTVIGMSPKAFRALQKKINEVPNGNA